MILRFSLFVALIQLVTPVVAETEKRDVTVMLTTKSFYFIRHGETDYNLHQKAAGGGIDAPLNRTGIKQAQQLKPLLSSITFDAVVASPMLRVHQTVEHALGIKPHAVYEDLREQIWGKQFEDGPLEPLRACVKTLTDDEPIPGGGESRTQFRQRTIIAVNTILENHSGTILIAAHAHTLNALAHAMGLTGGHWKNAALYHCKHTEAGWAIDEVTAVTKPDAAATTSAETDTTKKHHDSSNTNQQQA